MDLRILGCYGGAVPGHRTTNFVVNETVAIDAGALAFSLEFEQQLQIRHVFISHAHLDHTNSLPFLIDNVFGLAPGPIHVYSIAPVLDALRAHLFNDVTWPDFSVIEDRGVPILQYHEIKPYERVEVDGLMVTAVPVNHIVPCVGFLVDDGSASVLYSSDTGPCPALYEFANSTVGLKMFITEVSFPNEMQEIADLSRHLTPASFAREISQLRQDVDVLLYHLKPPYIAQLHVEIRALGLDFVRCLDQDRTYRIG